MKGNITDTGKSIIIEGADGTTHEFTRDYKKMCNMVYGDVDGNYPQMITVTADDGMPMQFKRD